MRLNNVAITATNHFWDLTPMADGTRNSKYPDGTTGEPPSFIDAKIRAVGWGQTVTTGGTLTGPAPLAVCFDAIQTLGETGVRAWDEYGYHFDFGYASPSTPGTWTYYVGSGQNKGQHIGFPVCGHVFETPGTYSVTVRAQNAGDVSHDDATVTVVVQDPATVYATTSTVLCSTDGTSDGATYPSATVRNVATSGMPTAASNTRYLFKAAQDFTPYGSGNFTLGDSISGSQVGRWGAGADPILGNLTLSSASAAGATPVVLATKIMVYDLTLNRFTFNKAVHSGCLRCTISGNLPQMGYIWDSLYESSTAGYVWPGPDGLWMVENTIDYAAGNEIYLYGRSMLFMGNHVINTYQAQTRMKAGEIVAYQHNYLEGLIGINNTKAAFKCVAETGDDTFQTSYTAGTTGSNHASRYVSIEQNHIGSDAGNTTYILTIGPLSDSVYGRLREVGVQENQFRCNASIRAACINIEAEYVTVRGNTLETGTPGANIDLRVQASHTGMTAAMLEPNYSDVTPETGSASAAPAKISPSKAGS